MPTWKLNIFVNAIKARIKAEDKSAQDIIADYTKLTEIEKAEILAVLTSE